MDAIKAGCNKSYRATRHSGTRPISGIRLIVMHDTEGGTAESTARYFSEPVHGSSGPGGSAHLVVDDNHCYRCLTNADVAWGAPGANVDGFHIEQCGYASWSALEWGKHSNMLHRGAFKAAYHCKLFNVPPHFVDYKHLATQPGITTHAEITKAYPAERGTHTDPGEGWPRSLFIALVRHYYDELGPAL